MINAQDILQSKLKETAAAKIIWLLQAGRISCIFFVFVYKPNVIEPCAPGVAAHHEHPGLPHQLDQSAPVLGSHLISIIMVMVIMKTMMMRKMRMMSWWF